MPSQRRYTEAQFRAAVDDPDVRTIADLCRRLGLVPRGGNYESLRAYADELHIDLGETVYRRSPQRPRWHFTDEDLSGAVAASRSIAQVIRSLGREPSRWHYTRVKQRIQDLGLGTSHMTGQGWNVGGKAPPPVPARPLPEVLVEGRRTSSSDLRKRLLDEGIVAHRCAGCGGTTWRGRPIPLELDHIDGDRFNNRLGNLRLLCPNCHALTPTYRGRNIGRGFDDL